MLTVKVAGANTVSNLVVKTTTVRAAHFKYDGVQVLIIMMVL